MTSVDSPASLGAWRLRVGATIWLASELMFFGGLFAAYFALRAAASVWPPSGVDLDTARALVATGVLVASSMTMHRAHRSAEESDLGRHLLWLGATFLMGLVFLVNQVLEYGQLPFSIASHAYGSIFYLLTGFHGLHVAGGLVLMGFLVERYRRQRAVGGPGPAIVASYYWHFVDAVWVAVFATLYLLR